MTEFLIALAFFSIGLLVKDFFPSYMRKKAENLATKEDIETITEKVESVRSEIAFNIEREKQFLDKKQEFLMNFYDDITDFHYEKLAVNFGDFPHDEGKTLFEYQISFYKLVAQILKSYQRLVIFLPQDSDLLKFAHELTKCVTDSRKVIKENFGSIKNTFIAEGQAMVEGNKEQIEITVKAADEANSIFWKEMRPSVERFRENFQHFLKEMNQYITTGEKRLTPK
jgi:hypothetical protein